MKEVLREKILALGADVCGFAEASAFTDAPEGFAPRDIFPKCNTVIALGTALPKGIFDSTSRLVYTRYNPFTREILDALLLRDARLVEEMTSARAVPLPSDAPYDEWDEESITGRGIISMKHAAVLAGLGALGKNTLLLNAKFGNRLTVGAVLTDLTLEGDEIAKSVCIPGCKRCVEACPAGAIGDGRVDQSKCRPHAYTTNARGFDITACNKCRAVCPMRYGK